MDLPKIGTVEGFAFIVDVNSFTTMVAKTSKSDSIAQFVRDFHSGGIGIIERNNGSVVSFMGDAFLAILENVDSVYHSCIGLAKDVDRQCEYISTHQREFPEDWHYSQGGPSLKIGIEYGWIDISTIHSELLGTQRLLIGPGINYACRIASAGEGNRCHVGPKAMEKGMDQWWNEGPYKTEGKTGEGEYTYWSMELGDIWRSGKINSGEDTYWG